eukprot:GHRQ01022592.1.p1 GENE.GHRQ01022592.1~~GHRQ01022592.1.p1  ORF type:complete len:153 (-),score=16.46 GHRQ01022592.1:18-476(-)
MPRLLRPILQQAVQLPTVPAAGCACGHVCCSRQYTQAVHLPYRHTCCRLRLVAPYAAKRGVALPSAPAPSMLNTWPPAGCSFIRLMACTVSINDNNNSYRCRTKWYAACAMSQPQLLCNRRLMQWGCKHVSARRQQQAAVVVRDSSLEITQH